MLTSKARQSCKKRIPKLAYTDHRGIGWHVSFRDPANGLPRKYRFGRVPEDRRAFFTISGSPSISTAILLSHS